jgi:hypothetical protein
LKKAFFIFLVFLFSSCKKEQFRKEIAGTWEFEKHIGEPFLPPSPPGNGRIIVLYESGRFERWQHDTLIFKGTYKLDKKDDCEPRIDGFSFSTNDPNFSKSNRIDIMDGKLTLSTPSCYIDGGTSYYRRLK